MVASGGHRLEALAEQSEVNHLDRTRRARRRLALHRCDPIDPRIRKNGGVKFRGRFRFFCVPEERMDFRLGCHFSLPCGSFRTKAALAQAPKAAVLPPPTRALAGAPRKS